MPYCVNSSAASTDVLLHVQRKGDSGSPRVTGSMSFSSFGQTSGCCSSYGRWPEPLRRMLTTSLGFAPARASSLPFLTVLMAIFVARATAATPPQPNACASLPAHNRRPRSSSVGFSIRHFSRTNFSRSVRRATTDVDHLREILSIPHRAEPHRTILDRLFHSRALTPRTYPVGSPLTGLPRSGFGARPAPPCWDHRQCQPALRLDLRWRGRHDVGEPVAHDGDAVRVRRDHFPWAVGAVGSVPHDVSRASSEARIVRRRRGGTRIDKFWSSTTARRSGTGAGRLWILGAQRPAFLA